MKAAIVFVSFLTVCSTFSNEQEWEDFKVKLFKKSDFMFETHIFSLSANLL